jgi:nucleoside-diphosphate-sugar epimerase
MNGVKPVRSIYEFLLFWSVFVIIAVTGGTGFIGRHLIGDEVRYLTRRTLTYRHCYQAHKIEAELGYQHKNSMTEGISELVRYAK